MLQPPERSSSKTMTALPKLALAAAALVTAHAALAANPKDLARAQNNQNFSECIRCDLSNANFENRFLQLAVLIEANLSGSNFDGATLAGTQLTNANLSKATFRYANLSGAQMQGADLRGADFKGAWLNWAWLAGAKLEGADFTGAHFVGTQLQGTDLTKAKGITTKQLQPACANADTILPSGVGRPWCPY